ncbi:MAG: hypothetical protein KBH14_18190 [Vicinamibacteria bacterium]|jgi:hypothetical protein|nr:hypothetical protein [Vicinamibacteria bacterium]MBP9948343.1 hypothetical protein [Vicinamibacteria bacterium]
MTTPRSSFAPGEGRLIQVILFATMVLFFLIMGAAWHLAEEANPVLLDLETGKPVATRNP